MRVFDFLGDLDVVELDVQELVHGFQGSSDQDVVLELDGHFVIDQGLEEASIVVSIYGLPEGPLVAWSGGVYLKNSMIALKAFLLVGFVAIRIVLAMP